MKPSALLSKVEIEVKKRTEKKLGKKIENHLWEFHNVGSYYDGKNLICIPKEFEKYIDNLHIMGSGVLIHGDPKVDVYFENVCKGIKSDSYTITYLNKSYPIFMDNCEIYENCYIRGNVIIKNNVKIHGNCKIMIDSLRIILVIKDNLNLYGDIEITLDTLKKLYFDYDPKIFEEIDNKDNNFKYHISLGGNCEIYDEKSLKNSFFLEVLKNGI